MQGGRKLGDHPVARGCLFPALAIDCQRAGPVVDAHDDPVSGHIGKHLVLKLLWICAAFARQVAIEPFLCDAFELARPFANGNGVARILYGCRFEDILVRSSERPGLCDGASIP
jgi:hypothetical protein